MCHFWISDTFLRDLTRALEKTKEECATILTTTIQPGRESEERSTVLLLSGPCTHALVNTTSL